MLYFLFLSFLLYLLEYLCTKGLSFLPHLFFFLFGCTTWLVGSLFPNQGLNPGPLQRVWSSSHWPTREFSTYFF